MELVGLLAAVSQANFGIIPTVTLVIIYFKLSRQTEAATNKLAAAFSAHDIKDEEKFRITDERLNKIESHIGIQKLKEI